MTTAKVRIFDPGDGTRYNYQIQHVEFQGDLKILFSFGINNSAMISVMFNLYARPDYYYFLEKYGKFEKNGHTVYIAYVLFAALVGFKPWNHEVSPSFGRNFWKEGWIDNLDHTLVNS